jgi:hypothetical protein
MCDCNRLDCLECGIEHFGQRSRSPCSESGWASPPAEVKLEPMDLDQIPRGDHPGFSHTPDHAPGTASTSTSTPTPESEIHPAQSSHPSPAQSLTGNTVHDTTYSDQESNVPHQPRLYQRTAIKAVNDAFESGVSRVGVSAPTGSGKTFIFAHVISQLLERYSNGKVMVLVYSQEQANQAEDKIDSVCGKGNIKVGHERASSRARNHSNV